MQVYNYHYQNKAKLETFIQDYGLHEKTRLCVQIFCGVCEPFYIQSLIDTMNDVLPGVPFIGTTTNGEIINGQVTENQTVLSFSCFDHADFKSAMVLEDGLGMFEMGQRLGKQLISPNTKALIVFSGGNFLRNFERANQLRGIQSVSNDVILAGGVAGNPFCLTASPENSEENPLTHVFTEKGISNGEALVGLSLSGLDLIVNNGCNLGWKTVGKKMVVNRVEKKGDFTRVFALDETPPMLVYEKYFGEDVANNINLSALEFSFITTKNGFEIAAVPMQMYDDGSILFTANLNEGDTLQFGFGHPGLIINRSSEIAYQVAQYPVEALYIYSCATRRTLLSYVTKDEVVPFQNIAPMAGFFTFGEFYHHEKQHLLVGQTMTILAVSEKKEVEKPPLSLIKNETSTNGGNKLYDSMTAIHTMIQRMTEELEDEKHRSERLLLNILPESIADQLRERVYSIAESFSDVTVLFADIVGFTDYSASHFADEVVEVLNKIFSLFDQLTEKNGLEKIKTIGDAYMIAGGIPVPVENHTEKTATMAIEMMKAIAGLKINETQTLSLRIGIDCGPVVAGVLGTKKFAYDLWGDTVNTASRMESHGVSGKIQVTESVYLKLMDKFALTERGMIDVKGKGRMKTYFLEY